MRGITVILALLVASGCGRYAFDNAPDAGASPGSPLVGFQSGTTLVDETSGTVQIPVLLSEPGTAPVRVRYRVTGGSATSDDFTLGGTGELEIPAGATQGAIDLTITDDGVVEANETIELVLESPEAANLGMRTHEITISANVLPRINFQLSDDTVSEESPAVFTVILTAPSASDVTFALSFSGSASPGIDYVLSADSYTIPAGSATKSFSFNVTDDLLDEADEETLKITMHSTTNAVLGPMVTWNHRIADNDAMPSVLLDGPLPVVEEGGVAMIGIGLTAPSGREITVEYARVSGNASGADIESTGSIVFPAGTTEETITLMSFQDALDEDDEVAEYSLTMATNASIVGNNKVVTILDDDEVPNVSFETGTLGVVVFEGNSGSTSTNYRLVLDVMSARVVSVDLALTGTAQLGTDFDLSPNPVIFNPLTTSVDVTVTVYGDVAVESNETIQMTLANPVNATIAAPTTVTHGISDDD